MRHSERPSSAGPTLSSGFKSTHPHPYKLNSSMNSPSKQIIGRFAQMKARTGKSTPVPTSTSAGNKNPANSRDEKLQHFIDKYSGTKYPSVASSSTGPIHLSRTNANGVSGSTSTSPQTKPHLTASTTGPINLHSTSSHVISRFTEPESSQPREELTSRLIAFCRSRNSHNLANRLEKMVTAEDEALSSAASSSNSTPTASNGERRNWPAPGSANKQNPELRRPGTAPSSPVKRNEPNEDPPSSFINSSIYQTPKHKIRAVPIIEKLEAHTRDNNASRKINSVRIDDHMPSSLSSPITSRPASQPNASVKTNASANANADASASGPDPNSQPSRSSHGQGNNSQIWNRSQEYSNKPFLSNSNFIPGSPIPALRHRPIQQKLSIESLRAAMQNNSNPASAHYPRPVSSGNTAPQQQHHSQPETPAETQTQSELWTQVEWRLFGRAVDKALSQSRKPGPEFIENLIANLDPTMRSIPLDKLLHRYRAWAKIASSR